MTARLRGWTASRSGHPLKPIWSAGGTCSIALLDGERLLRRCAGPRRLGHRPRLGAQHLILGVERVDIRALLGRQWLGVDGADGFDDGEAFADVLESRCEIVAGEFGLPFGVTRQKSRQHSARRRQALTRTRFDPDHRAFEFASGNDRDPARSEAWAVGPWSVADLEFGVSLVAAAGQERLTDRPGDPLERWAMDVGER